MVKHAHGAVGYARYIGRIGALAVALGIGTAVTNGNGIAYADSTEGTPNSSQGSENQSGQDPPSNPDPAGPEQGPPTLSADPPPGSSGSAGVKVNDPPKTMVSAQTTVSSQTTKITADEKDASNVDVVGEDEEGEGEEETEGQGQEPEQGTNPVGTTNPVIIPVPVDHNPTPPSGSPWQRVLANPPQPVFPGYRNRARLAEFQEQQPFSRSRRVALDPPGNTVQPPATRFAADEQDHVEEQTFTSTTAAVFAGPTQPTVAPARVTVRSVVSDVLRWFGLAPLAIDTSVPARPVPPVVEALWSFVRRLEYTFFNDRPTATHTVDPQNAHTGVITGKIVGDDGDDDKLTYTVTDHPDHGTVTVDGQGNYIYKPSDDLAETGGPDSFTVTVSDRIGNPPHVHGLLGLFGLDRPTTETVNLSVVPVDDEPLVKVGSGYAFDSLNNVTGAMSGHLTFTDEDDPVTYRLESGHDVTAFGTLDFDEETGTFTFRPTPQARIDAHNGEAPLDVSFDVVVTAGRDTTTTTVHVPLLDTRAPGVPLATGYDSSGPAVARPDGTVYQVAWHDGPGSDSTKIVIVDPNRATPIVIDVAGQPVGALQLSDDGTAYQTLWVPSSTGPSSSTVLIINPDGTVRSETPMRGRAFRPVVVGADGTAYQITDTTNTNGERSVDLAVIPSNGSPATITNVYGANTGQLTVGPDGTVYLPATDFDEGTPQYFIKAVRLQPDGTYVADFGVYLPGEAVGGVLFGPGGTAYQTVQSGNSVVVRNLATEADDAFLTGQAHGPAVIGEDGTIYLVTTRTDQQTGGISGQIVYVTPGDFPRGFGTSPDFEGPLILGPDGTAYLTSRTPGRQAGDQDDGTVIVTIRDGAFDTIPYDGVPAGTVRFAPDGTAYQITQSPVGPAAPVTMIYRLYDDNPEPVRLNGEFVGATFDSDGRLHVTTVQVVSRETRAYFSTVPLSRKVQDSTEVSGNPIGSMLLAPDGNGYQLIEVPGSSSTGVAIITPATEGTPVHAVVVFVEGEPVGMTLSGGHVYVTTRTAELAGEATTTVWVLDARHRRRSPSDSRRLVRLDRRQAVFALHAFDLLVPQQVQRLAQQ